MHAHLLEDIGISIVCATLLAYVARAARQPLVLAYIGAGVLIGPIGLEWINDPGSIQVLAELGLAFLLFIVGLEIDVKRLAASGRVALVVTLVQFVGSAACGWGLARVLGYSGLPALYLGAAVAFSSTMIVVKLLSDRSELDTVAGRLTLAVLLVQDALAIVVLAVQPNLGGGSGAGSVWGMMALSIVKGFGLVAGTFAISRWILPPLFRSVAKAPEIVLISAISWCFLVCYAAIQADFSSAMGALIAGVSISTFPYSLEVVAKIRSLRDFFVTLFFVSLGMLLVVPTTKALVGALALSGVVIVSRFATMVPVLRLMKFDRRAALLSSIHLSQISEFALVIMLLGVLPKYGHIGQDIVSLVVMVLVITATVSTYGIQFSHRIVRVLLRGASATEFAEPPSERTAAEPIVLVGCFRVASSLVDDLLKSGRRFRVIDFSAEVHGKLCELGVPCTYGDISHLDTLEHAGVEHAKILISSIPDDFLRGTSNRKLLDALRRINPHAQIFVTAESVPGALELYAAGADYVLMPRHLAADRLTEVVGIAERGALESLKRHEIDELETRGEVLL